MATARFSIPHIKTYTWQGEKTYRSLTIFEDKPLGRGGFGTVYLARYKPGPFETEKEVAVKVFASNTEISEAYHEAIELRNFSKKSPHYIVNYIDFYCDETGFSVLVMEKLECDISTLIKNSGNLSGRTLLCILERMIRAIDVLHSSNVVHRDIKPHNFLLGKDNSIKLGDFGYVAKNGFQKERFGTSVFVAPEVFSSKYKFHSTSADIYSFGATMLYMLYGNSSVFYNDEKYAACANAVDLKMTKNTPIPAEILKAKELRKLSTLQDKKVDPEILELALTCGNVEEEKRPKLPQIFDRIQDLIEARTVVKLAAESSVMPLVPKAVPAAPIVETPRRSMTPIAVPIPPKVVPVAAIATPAPPFTVPAAPIAESFLPVASPMAVPVSTTSFWGRLFGSKKTVARVSVNNPPLLLSPSRDR